MRIISSFPHHDVVRHPELVHTEHFVRDRTLIDEEIADLLAKVWASRCNRKIQTFSRKSCRWFVDKLIRELDGPHPLLRILEAARWYERHWNEEYIPLIDSGRSFHAKFSRLEAIMHDRTRQPAFATVDEVLTGLFNGSRVISDAFRSGILVRARHLDFGQVAEAELASQLGSLYQAICAERPPNPTDAASGPIDVLRWYIIWLSDKDWRMTMRVLKIDSPAFQQFRRELASYHPYGLDPITGR